MAVTKRHRVAAILLAVGLPVAVWLNWPAPGYVFPTMPSADIAALTGAPEDNYRLRVHLTGVRYTSVLTPWTELPEPSRSLWAVLSFEDVAANGGKVSQYRQQLAQDESLPRLDDVAAGYRNLGATRLAAWVEAAAGRPGAAHETVPAELLAEGHAAWVACARQEAEEIARRLE